MNVAETAVQLLAGQAGEQGHPAAVAATAAATPVTTPTPSTPGALQARTCPPNRLRATRPPTPRRFTAASPASRR